MAKKPPKIKDPNIYAPSLEYGYGKIPPRPLFANTLRDYEETFVVKIAKARLTILAAWK